MVACLCVSHIHRNTHRTLVPGEISESSHGPEDLLQPVSISLNQCHHLRSRRFENIYGTESELLEYLQFE